MNHMAERAAQLGVRLVLDALSERTGKATRVHEIARVEGFDAWLAQADIGGQPLAVCVVFIVPPTGSGPWYEAKAALEARIGGVLDGAYVLWAPSGAELPGREPHRSAVIARTEDAARRFVPGGHGEVRFPVVLSLRKSDEEGSYLTARGGLASAWAQFTGRVFGHYQLDSTELHRLPAGEGHLKSLVDRIAERANTLEPGQTVEIETEDAWTMQRLSAGEGLLIVGEPPGAELSSGAALRRNLRRVMQALRGPLLAQAGAARVVCFIGPYADFKDQPVGTALLGFDPTLYTGIDQILLAADGDVAPVLDLTRSALLAQR
jgi:hypothetical protein